MAAGLLNRVHGVVTLLSIACTVSVLCNQPIPLPARDVVNLGNFRECPRCRTPPRPRQDTTVTYPLDLLTSPVPRGTIVKVGANNSNSDVVGYYARNCPKFMKRLQWDVCSRGRYSCKGNCGVAPSAHHFNRPQCMCDELCPIFNDCCWDFQNQCPSHFSEYQQRFTFLENAAISCMNGRAIVSGTGEEKEEHDSSPTIDPREPRVNLDGKIDFINRQVLDHFYSNETSAHNLTFWDQLIIVPPDMPLENLQDYIVDGYKDERLVVVHEIIPQRDDIAHRECMPRKKIYCPASPTEDLCGIEEDLVVNSMADICDLEIGKSRGKLRVAHDSVMGLDHTSSTTPTVEDLRHECTIFTEKLDTETINIPVDHQVRVIVNFENIDQPIIRTKHFKVNKVTYPNIKNMLCRRNRFNQSCSLTAICKRGYLPLGMRCVKPSRVIARVAGAPVLETLETVLQSMFDVMKQTIDLDPTPTKPFLVESNDTPPSYMTITGDYQIQSYESAYTGNSLSVTPQILDQVRRNRKQQINSTSGLDTAVPPSWFWYGADVCFVLQDAGSRTNGMLCDRLNLENNGGQGHTGHGGLPALQQHFEIAGPLMPAWTSPLFNITSSSSGYSSVPHSLQDQYDNNNDSVSNNGSSVNNDSEKENGSSYSSVNYSNSISDNTNNNNSNSNNNNNSISENGNNNNTAMMGANHSPGTNMPSGIAILLNVAFIIISFFQNLTMRYV